MIELKDKINTETIKPKLVDIFYKNDDKTSFEFVIISLVRFFNKTPQEAFLIANDIHEKGEGRVAKGVLKNIAINKINTVTKFARNEGYPLEVFYKDCN